MCDFNSAGLPATTSLLDERGLTLLELTLILAVSIAMFGALMPSLSSTLSHAQAVRAQTDETNIALALNNALTDTGNARFTFDGSNAAGSIVNLLVSDGDTPRELAGVGSANWQTAVNNATGLADFLERHLVTNNPRGNAANDYPVAGANHWKGAYLNAPIDPDPWGNRYMVNSASLGTANSTYVLSAGPNEIIESVFVGAPTITAGGDDIMTLVR